MRKDSEGSVNSQAGSVPHHRGSSPSAARGHRLCTSSRRRSSGTDCDRTDPGGRNARQLPHQAVPGGPNFRQRPPSLCPCRTRLATRPLQRRWEKATFSKSQNSSASRSSHGIWCSIGSSRAVAITSPRRKHASCSDFTRRSCTIATRSYPIAVPSGMPSRAALRRVAVQPGGLVLDGELISVLDLAAAVVAAVPAESPCQAEEDHLLQAVRRRADRHTELVGFAPVSGRHAPTPQRSGDNTAFGVPEMHATSP